MDAAPPPVLPPRAQLLFGHAPGRESQHLRRRALVVVEAPPHEVAPGDEEREAQVQVAPLLAHEPGLTPQAAHQVARDRLGLVDREERVADVADATALRRLVSDPMLGAEGFTDQRRVDALLVGLDADRAEVASESRCTSQRAPARPA